MAHQYDNYSATEWFELLDTFQLHLFTGLCPVEWVSADQSCYKLIAGNFIGWQDSTYYCSATVVQQQQAQLVVINSDEKQRLIHKLLFTAYSGKQ